MVYYSWIGLVILSLWVSFVAFLWGLKSGQFKDQDRARFLPLTDDLPPPVLQARSRISAEAIALTAIAVTGFLVMALAVVISLTK